MRKPNEIAEELRRIMTSDGIGLFGELCNSLEATALSRLAEESDDREIARFQGQVRILRIMKGYLIKR